ncbi:MAG: DUF2924 domain-containing protein [Planctomycetes bacterium]|nr:DUF2924 domain-containing protein [Planctomycetota bacterium]
MKTKTKTANALAALKGMTPKQLRERYAELYGEPSRSGNKQWLIRRCAWRIQALAEGGLSERAERRARQLARDQDLRIIPPKDLTMDPLDRPADVQQPARRYIRRTHDARLPMPGEQITRVYKGHQYVVDVLEDGFAYDGKRYQSLSAVAHVITGGHWNGFKFFNREQPAEEAE